MQITFVSNYINHHQIPFCEAMSEAGDVEFVFIQTEPMEQERVQMGWNPEDAGLPYVRFAYLEQELCSRLVMDSDIVIWGGAEDETMLKPRLAAGKPVIRYSERLYRDGQWKAISPRGLKKKYLDHTRYRSKQVYLLAAGAYVASDFHIVRAYPDKMFRWGYFPELRQYDIDQLMKQKKSEPVEILWAARMIPLKHPEMVLDLASRLAGERRDFHITMIGGGELEPRIRQRVEELKLQDVIALTGFVKPDRVRELMERAEIFLMTSDRREGWGAVINEAMNSGCAVIADHMIGAAPYLIRHGENGFMYSSGKTEELYQRTVQLLDQPGLREQLGRNAYATIAQEWNAREGARRLQMLCRDICAGKEPEICWNSGPCSRAPILKERNRVPERL